MAGFRIFGFRNIWFLEYVVSGILGKGLSKVVGFISGIFGFDIPCFLEFARELRNLWLQQQSKSNVFRLLNKHFNWFWTVSNWFQSVNSAPELWNLWLQQHRTIFGMKEQRLNVTEQTFQLILNSIKLIPIRKFLTLEWRPEQRPPRAKCLQKL